MADMKGPAIFLAQFVGDEAPFDNLANMARWAGDLGYKGVQIPTWESSLIDLEKAAESAGYCDELKGLCAEGGVEISELSTHLQGQLVAVHPAYDELFDGFAPEQVRGKPAARREWAVNQLLLAARASRNLGLNAHATFSGATRFTRERTCTTASPSSASWRPRATTPAVIFSTTPVISCCSSWTTFSSSISTTSASGCSTSRMPSSIPAAKLVSMGFSRIFSQFARYRYDGWAVLEWECCLKHPEDGAREGVDFIRRHMIRTTDKAFDDFAGSGADEAANRRILGVD
jgi:sugar phosphate isomerase/epimerase